MLERVADEEAGKDCPATPFPLQNRPDKNETNAVSWLDIKNRFSRMHHVKLFKPSQLFASIMDA
jgi:hypothetical protein